ncbi:MAG: hypothetical protein Fur0022_29320 [Anaerolineales bacterium]
MTVYRSDPTQRGFSQPCPLWRGQCTIYTSPHYPHSCRAYTCNLFDEVRVEKTPLTHAFTVVEQAKALIRELDAVLPPFSTPNFRERLVAFLETPENEAASPEIWRKAETLVRFYEAVFGVKDLLEKPDEWY